MSDYPDTVTMRRLEQWPYTLRATRERARFATAHTTTLSQLGRELRHLGTGHRPASAVLQIAIPEREWRLDGLPRMRAVAEHPGVLLTVEAARAGALSLATDRFDHWHDNLRAIVLGLENLRTFERYGLNSGTEQYRGFAQLDAATAPMRGSSLRVDLEAALRAVSRWGHDDWSDAAHEVWVADQRDKRGVVGDLERVWRRARAYAHPDSVFGSRRRYDELLAAGEVLRSHGYEVRL